MRRAAATVLIGLVAVGCGGGTKPNGEQSKPPQQILADAEAALAKVHSFHMSGTATDAQGPGSLDADFVLPGKVRIRISQGGGTAELRVVDAVGYIRANQTFWSHNGPSASVATLLADKWLKVPANVAGFGQFEAFADPSLIGRCMLGIHHGTITKAGTGSVGGKAAVVLQDKGDAPGSSPGRVYIATVGQPLPLRAVQTGATTAGGTPDAQCHETADKDTTKHEDLRLTNWNSDVKIEAPAGALDLSQLVPGGGSLSSS